MPDQPTDDTSQIESTEQLEDIEPTQASSTYKVRGEFSAANGAGVLGRNTAGSGTPIGVEGAVPNASGGYGLSTPHDAKIDGILEVDSIVEATAGNSLVLRKDGGVRGLVLGADGTDEFGNTSGPNVVGGHASNSASDGAVGVTIGGGGSSGTDRGNLVADNYGTVAGGEVNTAGNPTADNDPTTAKWTTVGGGIGNTASAESATVAGGAINTATEDEATVAGGNENDATEIGATIGGGIGNTASGNRSTVGGGDGNTASAYGATVAGGDDNEATASGGTVPGGTENVASGTHSFAAGFRANATEDESFVWNGSENPYNVSSPEPYTFTVQADNGIWFGTDYTPSIGDGRFIDTSTGAYLSDTGNWNENCSVTVKEDFAPVEGTDVVEKVASLDVRTWTYEVDEANARHMGPTAEDFHATFELGDDEEHIAPLDTAGVALAAIQGLTERLEHAQEELASKDERIEELEDRLDGLEDRLERVEEQPTTGGVAGD